MDEPSTFSVSRMLHNKEDFMRQLNQHGHAVITLHGRHAVFAHRASSAAEAQDMAKQAHAAGLSPEPGQEPLASQSVDRYWDNLDENIRNMVAHRRSITLLTEQGKVVAILHNFVTDITSVLLSADVELRESLREDIPTEGKPTSELRNELDSE